MPQNLLNMELKELKNIFKEVAVSKYYEIENINAEIDLWFNLWKNKNLTKTDLMKMDTIDVLQETDTFFPDIRKALMILLTIPPTTANIERSFSTLRRVKIWLRSTMTESRLSGN
uniref:HAT C-terminal dimerisation domain-containing protein n=1 Tax=Cacopsylla melanoneura TaxID=428564 RepID=A0A8D8LGS4_9HEMI